MAFVKRIIITTAREKTENLVLYSSRSSVYRRENVRVPVPQVQKQSQLIGRDLFYDFLRHKV